MFADIMHWINLVECLLDYEMMYGRDKSAPTPAVCSLLYIYAMNKPFGVFVGLWMIVGRDKFAPTSTVCSLILRNEWALWSVCWIMNDVWARWISPYGVFADIMQWMSLAVCLLYYEMMYGRDESAPTPTGCSLIYILRNEWALWSVRWYTF